MSEMEKGMASFHFTLCLYCVHEKHFELRRGLLFWDILGPGCVIWWSMVAGVGGGRVEVNRNPLPAILQPTWPRESFVLVKMLYEAMGKGGPPHQYHG